MVESLTSVEPRTATASVQGALAATAPATPAASPEAALPTAESLTRVTPPDTDESAAVAPAEAPSQTALDRAKASAEKAVKAAAQNKQRREEAAAREQRAAAHEAENRRLRAEADERQRREDLYKTDKRALLRDYDVDARTLAQRQLEENTPEGLRRTMEEKFEQKLAEERTKREALESTIKQRDQIEKNAAIEAKFRSTVADATRYPNLAQQPYNIVLATSKQLLQDAFNRTGIWYSNEEVLGHLESEYTKSSAKPPGTAPTEKTETPASPRTISAKLASDRFSLPPNFDDLSDREQRRHLAKAYAESGKK